MDLDVVFLGTAGSMPTARRAPSATLIRRGGERLLVDCGEGTQRQLLRSDLGLVDLQEIFLTHFHADHFLGLPGMLKTFALRGRELPLTLYGPRGLEELLGTLRRIFGRLTYADGRVVTPDEVLGDPRPGRKLVLTGDTAPSDLVVEAAFGADVLVHEATFCEDEAERARETEHSTALEAARVARDAGVRLLALTHLSSRYGGGDVEREARTVFPETVVPRDFDVIEIPFPERGGPELVKRGARLPRAEVPSAP